MFELLSVNCGRAVDVAAATASVTTPPTMRLRETSGKDWVKSAEDGVSVILQSLGGEQISGRYLTVCFGEPRAIGAGAALMSFDD
jgi:hypothetical protein